MRFWIGARNHNAINEHQWHKNMPMFCADNNNSMEFLEQLQIHVCFEVLLSALTK